MRRRPADKDERLTATHGEQPCPGADEASPAGTWEVNAGQSRPPFTRNGVLLLPVPQGGEPVDLELVNRLRDTSF